MPGSVIDFLNLKYSDWLISRTNHIITKRAPIRKCFYKLIGANQVGEYLKRGKGCQTPRTTSLTSVQAQKTFKLAQPLTNASLLN